MRLQGCAKSRDRKADYQEAQRRIAEAREQCLTKLDLKNLIWDALSPELCELDWLEVPLATAPVLTFVLMALVSVRDAKLNIY